MIFAFMYLYKRCQSSTIKHCYGPDIYQVNIPITNLLMAFFKELNLPYPIANNQQFAAIVRKKFNDPSYTTILTQVDQYLHADLLQTCKTLGVTPQFIAVFGRPGADTQVSGLHADTTFVHDQWIKIPCGINWDLTPGQATFRWWDTGDCEELWPEQPGTEFPPQVNGINHKMRGNRDPAGFNLIESYEIKHNQPVLFRTDIPHQITYTPSVNRRICVSIRFSVDSVPTWEHALEIFEPLFKT
jgi:hypothetical protein